MHSKVHWENAKKVWYYEKWVGHHASFPPLTEILSSHNIKSRTVDRATIAKSTLTPSLQNMHFL